MEADLRGALEAVDWNSNVQNFLEENAAIQTIERGCHLVSVWCHELSFQDSDNPALPFLQEMKASLFHAPSCFSLGLYKPAASSMRAAVENALYFSYFWNHPAELKTLITVDTFYVSKKNIIEYHNIHTQEFKIKQRLIGFISELEAWYSEISAIVHGQIPGVWTTKSLRETSFSPDLTRIVLKYFSRSVMLINYLFLLVTDEDVWEGFSSPARQLFLKGMSGKKKQALGRATI